MDANNNIGAAAAGGKAGAYLDTDDYEIGINIGGKIAFALGIEADLDVAISVKPIVDGIKSIKDYFFPSIIEGKILTGCPTVLIG